MSTTVYFIDTNVFLYTAQCHTPDFRYLCEASTRFLDDNLEHSCTSEMVFEEVDHQLHRFPEKYKGATRVRKYLRGCRTLPALDCTDLIDKLFSEYLDDGSEQGWTGDSDDNDRLHAAVASAFDVDFLVTWDHKFTLREPVIRKVNEANGLRTFTFLEPS